MTIELSPEQMEAIEDILELAEHIAERVEHSGVTELLPPDLDIPKLSLAITSTHGLLDRSAGVPDE